MTVFRVGTKVPELAIGADTVLLKCTPACLNLFVLVPSPTPKEIDAADFHRCGVKLGVLPCEDFLVVAMRTGKSRWVDTCYEPHLAAETEEDMPVTRICPPGTGIAMNLIYADSANGLIHHMCTFTLSNHCSNVILKAIWELQEKSFDVERTLASVKKYQASHLPQEVGEKLRAAYFNLKGTE